MTRLFYSAVLLAGLLGCSHLELFAPEDKVALRSGTSFGMCVGYCSTELVIRDDVASFTRTSRSPSQYPAQAQSVSLTEAEAEALRAAVASSSLLLLKNVYGCPDCADGGAEWLEIGGRKVTLEY